MRKRSLRPKRKSNPICKPSLSLKQFRCLLSGLSVNKLAKFLLGVFAFLLAHAVSAYTIAALCNADLIFFGLRPTLSLLIETIAEELIVVAAPLSIAYVASLRLFREVYLRLLVAPVFLIWSLYHIAPPLPYDLSTGLVRMWCCVLDFVVAILLVNRLGVWTLLLSHLTAHVLWNLSCPILVFHIVPDM